MTGFQKFWLVGKTLINPLSRIQSHQVLQYVPIDLQISGCAAGELQGWLDLEDSNGWRAASLGFPNGKALGRISYHFLVKDRK